MKTLWIYAGAALLAIALICGFIWWTMPTVTGYLVLTIGLSLYMGLQYEDPGDPVWRRALSALGYGLQWPLVLTVAAARLFGEE